MTAEASAGGEMEWFVKNGFTVLSPDLIGIGEMGPGVFKGDAYIEGNSHNMWYASMLIGRSIAGIRAGDVVRLSRLLKKGSQISEVYGLARKELAPVMLHAAAFEQSISHIALVECYSSYISIDMNRFYKPSFIHGTVPGALKAYDLPDLAASLAPRRLIMVNTTDGNDKHTELNSIDKDLEIIKTAYGSKNVTGQLKIATIESVDKLHDLFMEWIK
jgi:hypothetical protein